MRTMNTDIFRRIRQNTEAAEAAPEEMTPLLRGVVDVLMEELTYLQDRLFDACDRIRELEGKGAQ